MRGLFKRWDNRNVIASPRSHWIPIHFPKPATVHLRPFTSTTRPTAFVSWKSSYRVRERQLWKFKFLFPTSPFCQIPFPSSIPLYLPFSFFLSLSLCFLIHTHFRPSSLFLIPSLLSSPPTLLTFSFLLILPLSSLIHPFPLFSRFPRSLRHRFLFIHLSCFLFLLYLLTLFPLPVIFPLFLSLPLVPYLSPSFIFRFFRLSPSRTFLYISSFFYLSSSISFFRYHALP